MSKKSSKSLYLARFSRYKHFLCFCKKFENSKWPPFSVRPKFFENCMATLQRYPVGQKNFRNRSIQHGFREISIFVCCNFCETFENSKWPPFSVRQKFFESRDSYSTEIPTGSKISSKSLYLARFSRYTSIFVFCNFCEKFKMTAILARENFFEKLGWLLCRDTLWVKNFVNIALSRMVFEI